MLKSYGRKFSDSVENKNIKPMNCGSGRPMRAFWAGIVLAGSAWAQGPTIATCPVLPTNNIWNMPVDQLPVSVNSATYVNTIGAASPLHPDFGTVYNGAPNGIPFITVPGTQTKYPATFLYYDESDPGPYAVPLDAPIEGGSQASGDRHAISIDTTNCILYEIAVAYPQAASWQGAAGAIFDLNSNALRPQFWTSTDAAGLPVFAGLIRYDEVLAGAITHAVRFTVAQSQHAYVWPARHYASSLTGSQYPPMGVRFRLRASFDVSSYSATNQIILNALKKYGMMLADNGANWYISGAPDSRWNDDDLHNLVKIMGSNFEAVDVSPIMINVNSGQAGTCDLNDDGVVNAIDVQLQINAVLQSRACGAGDLNGDGVCDSTDLQRVIQTALGQACHVGP
jgi:Dockerin type I domain